MLCAAASKTTLFIIGLACKQSVCARPVAAQAEVAHPAIAELRSSVFSAPARPIDLLSLNFLG
jgi:hypothetical protein